MLRKASAVWNGSLKEGKGTISTDSKVLSNAQYSFSTRFENGIGTNPEELIAAAHAGCFTMALSSILSSAGHPPDSVGTDARVHLRNIDGAPTLARIDLDTVGQASTSRNFNATQSKPRRPARSPAPLPGSPRSC